MKMKKLTTLILFILFSQISKSQSYNVYLNGNEWPGYAFSCYNGNFSGTVSVNGSNSTFSYQWLNGDNSDTLSTSLNFSAPAGFYIFKIFINGVTDNEFDFYIFEEDQLLSELTPSEHGSYNITSYLGNDGEISNTVQGGRTPYTYSWSNGKTTKDIDSLIAGTYSVTVTDNEGCQVTNSVTLIEPAGPLRVVSISSPTTTNTSYNISEKGKTDGKINLVVAGGAGPYKYEWYPYGNPTNHPDTLAAREYTVVITDNNNATITQKITLKEPDKLNLSLTKQDLSCHSCGNGSITATVTGGATPYTYLWNSGQTTATISNLPSRDYVVMVTDANGARIKEGVYLKEPDRDDWSITGNSGITSSQFIGTTDNKDLVFKTNGIARMKIGGQGNINFTEKLILSRISSSDSLIAFGDSSIILDHQHNRIYANSYWPYRGLAIGDYRSNALALGSVTIGNLLSTTSQAGGSIIIGSGYSTNNGSLALVSRLTSTIENTILLGTRSNLPTITIFPGSGLNTYGTVSIAADHVPTNYKLAVGGKIIAEEIEVKLHQDWPDFVFNKDYLLMSLKDLARFINRNGHLPEIPSSNEIKINDGIPLGEMQSKLLKKIEELTLYILQQNETIQHLQSSNDGIIKDLNTIKKTKK
jgi:hypothetical protein